MVILCRVSGRSENLGVHILIQGTLKKNTNSLPVKICSSAPDMCLLNDALIAKKWVHWSNSWDIYSLHLCGWQFLFVKLLGNNCYFSKQKLWQYIIFSWKKNTFEFWSNCHYCHFCSLSLNDNLGPKFLSDLFLDGLFCPSDIWIKLKAIRFVNSVCTIFSLRKQGTPHQTFPS